MHHRHAHIAVHVAALLFGLTGVFGELIQATAIAITFGRALFAVLALAGFARLQGRDLLAGITPRRAFALAGSGALLTVHWITFFVAVKIGGIAVATLGFASFPAFITVLEGALYRERVHAAEWVLLALVSAGLILVTPSFDFADRGTAGLAWGVASGLAFALLALANRQAAAGLDAIQVACWQNAVVAFVTAPAVVGALGALRALDWLWLATLGVFCTGLSHYLFVASLRRLNARTAGMAIALEPVYAIAFAWMLFAQQPTPRMLAGAGLIVAAAVYSARRPRTGH